MKSWIKYKNDTNFKELLANLSDFIELNKRWLCIFIICYNYFMVNFICRIYANGYEFVIVEGVCS